MSTAVLDPAVESRLSERYAEVDRVARWRKRLTYGVFGLITVYLIFSFIQFDIASVARKWNPDRAAIFLLDSYAHKDHVEMRWDDPEGIAVEFEGASRHVYDPPPAWFEDLGDAKLVNMPSGAEIEIFPDRVLLIGWKGSEEIFVFRRDENNIPYVEGYRGREDQLPPEFRVTATKVEVRSEDLYERIQVYKTKLEVHRYKFGWAFFWFDFNSPLAGTGPLGALQLMFSGDRVDPEQSNTSLVISEFLSNDLWFHGDVFYAMFETVMMALLGTMLASLVGLPLAFLAARNVQPLSGVRFVLRRLFDLLRGVDTLIWSLIFLRAFGPGLFTGIFAIAFTDTGTLGKLMSEAIENADNKQREGIQSTGARKVQQHRFGIIPQIMPVFISQSLYYLESNTRGAVIIGAMGAGGIGLKFLGAIQTGTDWENVVYISALVLLTVILMDMFSARLRRALIGIGKT